jgi:hypothetical protein
MSETQAIQCKLRFPSAGFADDENKPEPALNRFKLPQEHVSLGFGYVFSCLTMFKVPW